MFEEQFHATAIDRVFEGIADSAVAPTAPLDKNLLSRQNRIYVQTIRK